MVEDITQDMDESTKMKQVLIKRESYCPTMRFKTGGGIKHRLIFETMARIELQK